MAEKIPHNIAVAVTEIADGLIDSAETQLYELKRLGYHRETSPMHGQYTYWKNYRSAMRDLKRIVKSRTGASNGIL